MSAVAEQNIDLTDEQIEELLQVPEIKLAFDRYEDTKGEYRSALVRRFRQAPRGELPDVSDIGDRFIAELEKQEAQMRRLVLQHIQ